MSVQRKLLCFRISFLKVRMSDAQRHSKKRINLTSSVLPTPKRVPPKRSESTLTRMQQAFGKIAAQQQQHICGINYGEDETKSQVIDVFCYAQRLFYETFGHDACQSNTLFELQTLRMLKKIYDSDINALTYSGNVRSLPDALEKSTGVLHEFKSRQAKPKSGFFHIHSSTPIGTWQHPDAEAVVAKMSDPNRRTTYALRHIGALEPVFAIHIFSEKGRRAEIQLYASLTSKYVAKKNLKNSTYVVTCGMLLGCVGCANDYAVFIHGKKVNIAHDALIAQIQSATGLVIAVE